MSTKDNGRFLLALHSSTKMLGIAVIDLKDEKKAIKSSVFKVENELSKNLFNYVETLIPKKDWSKIARLAVATGPGSFTGTRLTIVMARTLAQQINCHIDGISSFALMAPRLSKRLNDAERNQPFWIIESLKRRGKIAGKYQILGNGKQRKTIEIKKPSLLKKGAQVQPSLEAIENVSEDIKELIYNCLKAFEENKKNTWQEIIPLYPTSPVENLE